MKKSLILASLLGPLLLTPMLSVATADLVATADDAGSLTHFTAALKQSGLDATLHDNGPYTVFAPSDQAFARLPHAEREALHEDKDKLARLLAYHVLPGKTLIVEVKPGKADTAAQAPVVLTSDNGIVTINSASVVESDLVADNGVIHIIDRVLLPPATVSGQDAPAPADPAATE